MNIKEIRRKNLRRLIDSRFNGKQIDLSRAIDRQPDYVSRCLKGTKGIGEDFARDIEQKLNLSSNWFDTPENTNNEQTENIQISPREKIFIDLINALPTIEQDKLLRELEEKERYFCEVFEDLKRKAG